MKRQEEKKRMNEERVKKVEEEKEVKRQKREKCQRTGSNKELKRTVEDRGKGPVTRDIRLADKKYTCPVCGIRGRVDDEMRGIKWYGCDEERCGRWFHQECLTESERQYAVESIEENTDWFCSHCKPWLYEEE